MAAEYIFAGGNTNVILCERGIRTFEKLIRNNLDISAVPLVKMFSHLPIIIDPSHAAGKSRYIESLSLAGIAAFGRTEADTEELFSVQRDYLYRTYPQARIFTLTIPGVVDVSSTDLRTMLAKGEGVNLLPPAVYGYILREGLYGTRADLKRLPLRELRPIALSYLKNKRIPHVLGTEQEAIRLAERYLSLIHI